MNLQILVDIAREGASVEHSPHAKVITVDPSSQESRVIARDQLDRELDSLFNQIANGWTPLERPAAVESAPGSDDDTANGRSLRGKLPDDFPGREALEAAGIDTYGKVRAVDDLTSIDGIGTATEAKIRERMQADWATA